MQAKLKFYLFNILVVVLALGISEYTINYLLNHAKKIPTSLRPAFKAYYNQYDRNAIQVIPACARYDSGLFYTLRPGRCEFSNREFRTNVEVNSEGLRDDEASLNFPEIVILGDSFAMGWGVDQDSTFANVLERTSGRVNLNGGISSYGTAREVKLLERLKTDSLKVIIIQYHPNDTTENKAFALNHNRLSISSENTYNQTIEEVQSSTAYYFGKFTSLLLKVMLKGPDKPAVDSRKEKQQEVHYFVNALLHSNVSLEKVKLIVFEAAPSNTNSGLFSETLKEEIQNQQYPGFIQGMTVLDMSEILTEEDYFVLDNHINASGHKKIATLLTDHISNE